MLADLFRNNRLNIRREVGVGRRLTVKNTANFFKTGQFENIAGFPPVIYGHFLPIRQYQQN
ncbi:hypothetical protein LJR153_000329 [Paenibacillus sp. LjRoot153]|uniref:hypothetical protein n=1 Tax=Paenibacillus sp. LjRoot153 TaxID=3342270 RepID=UPI003ECD59D2